MIFLTVGTQFPFDRLVKSVDQMISQNGFKEEIFAQIGESLYRPNNFEGVPFLEKRLFDKRTHEASSIISHAGVGTITIALEASKPLLVMPRLKRYGEVVNDHQVAIARKFGELGHILVAYKTEEMSGKIEQLRSFVPKKRESQAPLVVGRIRHFLEESVLTKM
jgi:UDP-N-acetylglucosamine transferase subunit ALG13